MTNLQHCRKFMQIRYQKGADINIHKWLVCFVRHCKKFYLPKKQRKIKVYLWGLSNIFDVKIVLVLAHQNRDSEKNRSYLKYG